MTPGFHLRTTSFGHVPITFLSYAWIDASGHEHLLEIKQSEDLYFQGDSLVKMGEALMEAARAQQPALRE